MTWMALCGAPQDEYAGCPSNSEMTLFTAVTPTVDGYHGCPNLYLHTRGADPAPRIPQWGL